jgi:FMN phosphatase YigB (HAD superfamily)
MPFDIKVLAFDVFGTVVDWRSSVIAEGEQFGKTKGLNLDWAEFADAWRAIYRPYMDRVGNGQLPWTKLDIFIDKCSKKRWPSLVLTRSLRMKRNI